MTTTTKPQYRKTKVGQWVVFGPADAVHVGSVEVTKRDGTTKTEYIASVGKDFQVDGITCRYGYTAPKSSSRRPRRDNMYGPVRGCGLCRSLGEMCPDCAFDTYDN